MRLIFTLFVTLGLLAGATLFFGTEGEVVQVGESLEPVVQRVVELAAETAERLEEEAWAAVAAPGSRVGGSAEALVLPSVLPWVLQWALWSAACVPDQTISTSLWPSRQIMMQSCMAPIPPPRNHNMVGQKRGGGRQKIGVI